MFKPRLDPRERGRTQLQIYFQEWRATVDEDGHYSFAIAL